jgi:2-polyprenyl-3-methyl-5-hydroxy-6-metoxy-1,4-benzoquinol methylase
MDDPDCDKQELFNTYDQFSHVNGLISRWKSLFYAYIAPLATGRRALRVLDIGCGGGDICMKFSEWANESGIPMEITGIDPDPRAHEYIATLDVPENVEFRQAYASDLIEADEHYDVVISNHLLHHLKRDELLKICRESEKLASKLILFNDIRRSDFGFAAFGIIAPVVYRSSFIFRDGLTSIRRSFRYRELKSILPDGWKVKKLFPFRLLVLWEKV